MKKYEGKLGSNGCHVIERTAREGGAVSIAVDNGDKSPCRRVEQPVFAVSKK
jgi:hypothetical protein